MKDPLYIRLMNIGPWLPLELCSKSQRRWIRVLGMFWYFLWFFPSMIILGIPIVLTLFYQIFKENVWDDPK